MTFKEPLSCPFCPFEDDDANFLIQHVESIHPENSESPFVVKDDPTQDDSDPSGQVEGATEDLPDYLECICGEFCLLSEFDGHLELHYAEGMSDGIERAVTDVAIPELVAQRRKATSPDMEIQALTPTPSIINGLCASIPITSVARHSRFQGQSCRSDDEFSDNLDVMRFSVSPTRGSSQSKRQKHPQRLGKAELGPHADEEKMPTWLRKKLETGAKATVLNQITRDGRLIRTESIANEIRGIIPVLGQLCDQENEVTRVYLCHPDVTHVVKLHKEGGFCGYRNIQMMISYIRYAKSQGCEHFTENIPSILHLQDMIEHAWDMGINSSGRVETGGIRGSRKYIGTPEAQALLDSLNIGCSASAFSDATKSPIFQQVLEAVEQYFQDGRSNPLPKVCRTSLPPIYFQHPGHSLTIIGFERRKSGTCNLLVLDPMFRPSPGIRHLIGAKFRAGAPAELLEAYRRGASRLRKYKTFEILKLNSRVPPKAGWYTS